jgi:hypothetical protein
MKQGFQMCCIGQYKTLAGGKQLFSSDIYTDKSKITEEVIEKFKDLCADGGGMFDLDKKTMKVVIVDVNIIE